MIVRTRELLVIILYQDNQPLKVVIVILGITVRSQRLLLALLHLSLHVGSLRGHVWSLILLQAHDKCLLSGLTLRSVMSHLGRRLQLAALQLGIDIIATAVLYHRITIGGHREVHPLVTAETDGQKTAVRLLHPGCTRMGWHCQQAVDTQQQGSQKQGYPLHLTLQFSFCRLQYRCPDGSAGRSTGVRSSRR